MTGVTDVLGGQKYLLQVQDLQLLQVNLQSNGVLNTGTSDLFSNNSAINPLGTYQSFSQSTAPGPYDFNHGILASEAAGRMFNTSNDTVAILAPTGTYFRLSFLDNHTPWTTAVSLTSIPPAGTVSVHVALGKFTGNGYASALAFYQSVSTSGLNWGMRIVAANDPNNEDALVNIGPEFTGNNPAAPLAPNPNAIAVGDFNNDGRDEIAILMQDGATIAFYAVDPSSMAITQTSTYQLPAAYSLSGTPTMIAGRFRDCGGNCQTNADLAIVGSLQTSSDPSILSVLPIAISPQSNGSFTAQAMAQSGATPFFQFPKPADGYVTSVFAHATPLANWPKPALEQLVIGVALLGIKTGNPFGKIEIGSFYTTGSDTASLGQFSWQSETPLIENHGLLFDVQVGNFDNLNPDGSYNPGLQVATYTAEGHNRAPHVRIYDVNVPVPFPPPPNQAPGNWLALQSDYAPTNGPVMNGFQNQQFAMLLPTDLESRSLELGPPSVVTIPSQVQPDVVLGIPPMHVAWIAPHISISQLNDPNCTDPGTPCLLNLTVLPSQPPAVNSTGFASGFTFSSSSKTQAKQSSTTSWGISVREGGQAKYSWGNALVGGSVSLKTAAQYTHDHSVQKTYDHYAGKTTNVAATTGFSDYVFYTQKRMNIYYYPVIGQTDCSSGTCNPQYVEFSVPDRVQHGALNADVLWWYQPVHQPGNVLSYPLDTAQLQQSFSDTIVPRTADPPTCLGFGTSNTTYSTAWTAGSGGGTTTGNANAFSQNVTVTVSAHARVEDVSGVKATASIGVGGNGSFSSLNENYASLSSSEGISVTVPAFKNVITTCCGYGWGDLVFGLQNTASPSAQTPQSLVTDPDGNPIPAANTFTGPMYVGFFADVLGNKPGGLSGCGVSFPWWQNVYTKPDVALNHPARWDWHEDTETVTFNAPSNPQQVNVLSQPFYAMKGFFISKQGDPAPAPNMASATSGDQLNLTVRVYNYSVVDTTAPVHVRIYGQMYSQTTGTLSGNAFEIGETTIASIPGFKSQSGGPGSYLSNWTTATVPFDTTNYANDYLVFWTVVWMQDGSGNLVAEMPDKGLSAIPGAGITQISDVPFEAHSNNVGLYGDYHQFYIAPQTTPGPSQTPGSLTSAAIHVAPQATLHQSIPVAISVTAGQAAPADGINIAYYDGDPAAAGALLNVQRVTHIEPGMVYTVNDRFLPRSCGVHTLYASAWIDDQPQVAASSPVNVTASVTSLVQSLIAATNNASIGDPVLQQKLLASLNAALSAFQNNQTAAGNQMLGLYMQQLAAAGSPAVSKQIAGVLIAGAGDVLGCSPMGFALSAASNVAVVNAGTPAQYSIALTPTGNFKGPVQLACAGAARTVRCAISQQSVTLDGTTQQTVTLTLTTVAASKAVSAAGVAGAPPRSRVPFLAWCLLVTLAALSASLLTRGRRTQGLWFCLALAMLMSGLAGCGSASVATTGATPSGPYTVSVTATSGNLSQSTSVTLYVR